MSNGERSFDYSSFREAMARRRGISPLVSSRRRGERPEAADPEGNPEGGYHAPMDYAECRMPFDALVGRINSGFAEVERAIEGAAACPEMLEPVNAGIAELQEVTARAPRALLDPVRRALDEGRLEDAVALLRKAAAVAAPHLTGPRVVTGRDAYIMPNGLAYAIAAIQSLPPHLREESDCDDMILLVCALVPDERADEHIVEGVRAHLGRRPDLTPPGDGP